MGKLARTIPVAVLVATALMVAPTGAGAATTIGETFTPPTACLSDTTWLQSTSLGGKYAAPSDGVLTSWSFLAPPSNLPTLKFKVARPAGMNSFTIIGDGGMVETPLASQLNTYPIRIPVQANDIIGFYSPTGGRHCRGMALDYALHRTGGDKPVSNTPITFLPEAALQIDVSAQLELDCDKDGLGDETQDTNLSSCAPGTIPPPAPGTAMATCRGLAATIVGTNGSDVRTGSQGQDVIVALGGNDTLSGLGGNDVICGGAGKDALKGGKGKDSLLGQKGKDALNGGPSRDFCKGGKGTDTASKCEVEKSI
jgi:RTX calcium-binding nonapeptide repeat (4 copies)